MRPYVPMPLRRAVFDSLHGLSHPGVRATQKFVTTRFVWPSINKDCRTWVRHCISCQRSKVTRHVTTGGRFEHVHIDIVGPLPISQGFRYCLTCIDRFSRWPEAVPTAKIDAETAARAFISAWIVRFGVSLRIITDRGRQFESHLFNELSRLIGATHLRTTSYHPQANGMVERLHRQMKAAIKCHKTEDWIEVLPIVLLGIRTAFKEDLKTTSAELVFGRGIRLPGEFFVASKGDVQTDFANQLRKRLRDLKPSLATRHGLYKTFVFKELSTSPYVFVRHDAIKGPLHPPYDGPFKVVKRGNKTFVININGKESTVSIDRLKPPFVLNEQIREASPLFVDVEISEDTQNVTEHRVTTRSGRVREDRVTTRPGRVTGDGLTTRGWTDYFGTYK